MHHPHPLPYCHVNHATPRRRGRGAALLTLGLLCCGLAQARPVVDTAGRVVEVPERIERVVTVGSVPVINSFVFAVGQGRKLVNGLPPFVKPPRDRLQLALAPQMKGALVPQGADRTPNVETLLQLRPDVILTMDAPVAESLSKRGFPTLLLTWTDVGAIARNVRLMGELFRAPKAAAAYIAYFDDTLAQVASKVSAVAPAQRPRVLYCQCRNLVQPHKIADWWIGAAGGASVTAGDRLVEEVPFSPEDLLRWNPDVIIAATAEDAKFIRTDARFSGLSAVQHQRVVVVPFGVHTWGNRNIEQPLTVLWAAKTFYPQHFADLDMVATTQQFYNRLLGYPLSQEQAREVVGELAH